MRVQNHRFVPAVALGVALLAAVVLSLAVVAAPARAFRSWAHDGAMGCVCHSAGAPTDASCTACHSGFQSYPGDDCWSCHAPGQETSTLSTPSSACSQECHLWNSVQKAYLNPTTHGANPHRGATPDGCVSCHPTSVSISDPGSSPHHSGQVTEFGDCQACHSTYLEHAGKVACTKCHTTAVAYHLYTADSPGEKTCRSCHAMKHDGKKVANKKCASCHKGTGSGPAAKAQHSSGVSKKYVCGGCHKQKLHAKSFGSAINSCRSCHGGKVHARQKSPGKSVCLRCHTAARHHDNGYSCSLCHRGAIHKTRPNAR